MVQPKASARVLAYALCLTILIPSLSFAAYLLGQMHTRELSVLHNSAQSRAVLAASYFDERMATLLGNLRELAGTPAAASENIRDRLRSEFDREGILVFTRGTNLDLLLPASGADAAVVSLDTPARTAAAAALSTLAPQITTYGAADKSGINIWIASTEKGSSPVLVQARIPSSFLASAFKNFISDGPWSISVIGSDGQSYAATNGRSPEAVQQDAAIPTLVEGFADTSQFGWRIAAGLPDRTIEIHARRNWMTFAALSSLLAIASFGGATLLTRSLIEQSQLNNLTPASQMPPSVDRPTKTQRPLTPDGTGQDRMRTALRAGNVGVWSWDLKTGLVHWDSEIVRILDRTPDSHDQVPRDLLRHVERHDRRQLLGALAVVISELEPLAAEIRIRRPDGETRWIAVRGAPTSIQNGKASALSGVAYDITDQKLSVSRTDALLREVSHRSKNLLALILAMARLTARDAVDVKSHLKDFTLRVAGLAASQDLIVASDWRSVDLATLASAEIGAVARTDAERVFVAGPPVLLTPEAAQTLGMVLTELTLNAVEHGALSSATGKVSLRWVFPDDNTVCITWLETGGPQFIVDGLKGYGRSVVERFSTQGLKLSAYAAAEPNGFKWTLTGPLANIGTRSEKSA